MDRVQPYTPSSVQDEESKPKFPLFQLGKKKSDCLLRVFPNELDSQPFLGEEIEDREVWQNGKVRVEVCNLLLQQEGLRCSAEVCDGWGQKQAPKFGFIKEHLRGCNSGSGRIFEFWLQTDEVSQEKKPRGSHGNDLV